VGGPLRSAGQFDQFSFCICFSRFSFYFCVSVSLDYFSFMLLVFFCWASVFSVPRQEIGWEERLRNDLFCVEWDVKSCSVPGQFAV